MAAQWFAVKTLYRSETVERPENPDRFYDPDMTLLEERVLLIKASGRGEALSKAEREARDYAAKTHCVNPYSQTVRTVYLGDCEIYELTGTPADKTEIFTTTRLISKRVPDHKIKHIYLGRHERAPAQSKRKKFINKNYSSGIGS